MGILIAVEGLDGAGKNTFSRNLCKELDSRNKTSALLSFPNYEDSPYARLAQLALTGRYPNLLQSPAGMAMIFAADRFHSRAQLISAIDSYDYVIIDRYIASNIVYTAAKIKADTLEDIAWLADIEYEILDLPRPDIQIYLATSVELSAQRTRLRAGIDSDRQLDDYEQDNTMQYAVENFYRLLAQSNWISTWLTVTDSQQVTEVVDYVIAVEQNNEENHS